MLKPGFFFQYLINLISLTITHQSNTGSFSRWFNPHVFFGGAKTNEDLYTGNAEFLGCFHAFPYASFLATWAGQVSIIYPESETNPIFGPQLSYT